MSARGAVSRMLSAVLPWPHRSERRVAIAQARSEAVRAQRDADDARKLADDLQQMRVSNHFAEAIALQLLQGKKR